MFPVQVAGYSSVDKKFHPCFVAVSTSEDSFAYSTLFDALKEEGYK
jgi:hypothetical protein